MTKKTEVPAPKLNLAQALMQETPKERERFPIDLGLELADGIDHVELIMPTYAEKAALDKMSVKEPDPDDPNGKLEKSEWHEYAAINIISQCVYPGTEDRVFSMDEHFDWMVNLPYNTAWLQPLLEGVYEFLIIEDVKKAKKK